MYIALNKFEISQFIDKYWGKELFTLFLQTEEFKI